MNEIINNIKTRRSIRKYKNDNIPDEMIEKIVEAGEYAPSGMNKQSSVILVIKNKEVRDELSKINSSIIGTSSDPFYGAPVVLVVLADKTCPTYIYDGSIVMQNLMLAANSLGLGSCWIHRAKETFETEYGKKLLNKLGLNDNYEGIGNCIIGYPNETPETKPRKDNYIYTI